MTSSANTTTTVTDTLYQTCPANITRPLVQSLSTCAPRTLLPHSFVNPSSFVSNPPDLTQMLESTGTISSSLVDPSNLTCPNTALVQVTPQFVPSVTSAPDLTHMLSSEIPTLVSSATEMSSALVPVTQQFVPITTSASDLTHLLSSGTQTIVSSTAEMTSALVSPSTIATCPAEMGTALDTFTTAMQSGTLGTYAAKTTEIATGAFDAVRTGVSYGFCPIKYALCKVGESICYARDCAIQAIDARRVVPMGELVPFCP